MIRLLRIAALLCVAATPALAGDLEGIVLNPERRPVRGAMVAVTPNTPNALSDGHRAAQVVRSDAQGRFHFKGLPGGHYGATATSPGMGAAFQGEVVVPEAGVAQNLILALGAEGITLEGRVSVRKGTLPQDIHVMAPRVSQDSGDLFYAPVEGGRYRLTLAPGTYGMTVVASGWETQGRMVKLPGDSTTLDFTLLLEKGSEPALHQELVAMSQADQVIRLKSIADPKNQALISEMAATDKQREERLKEVIRDHGWPGLDLVGPGGQKAAWLIVQHGSAALRKMCLPMLRLAWKSGELSGEELALTEDRALAVDEGKKQLYGSQFHSLPDGSMEPDPIEDEAHLDERRKAMGMVPFAEYKKELVEMYTPKTAAAKAP